MPPKRPLNLTPIIHPLGININTPSVDQPSNDVKDDCLPYHCRSYSNGGNEIDSGILTSSSLANSGNRQLPPIHQFSTPLSGVQDDSISYHDRSASYPCKQRQQQQEPVIITNSMTLVVVDAHGRELRVKDGVFEKSVSCWCENGEGHCCSGRHGEDIQSIRGDTEVHCMDNQQSGDSHGSSVVPTTDNCHIRYSMENNDENLNTVVQRHTRNDSDSLQERGDQRINYKQGEPFDGGQRIIENGIDSGVVIETASNNSDSMYRMDSLNRAPNQECYSRQNSCRNNHIMHNRQRHNHIRMSSNRQSQHQTSCSDPFLDNIRFDDLRIGMMLGKGSQGKVRMAQHRQTEVKYALKYMKIEGDNEVARRVYTAELQRIQALRHDNVTTSHEAFFRNNRLCIVLDYMDCGTMADILKGNRAGFPEDMLAYVAKGILSGLRHIHKEKVMHRDVKPANVLANSAGCVKLSDFGISRGFTGDISQDFNTVTVVGSRPYICPEMVQNKPYSFGCDIWSAGLTIAECFVGKYPFNVSKNASVFILLEVILKGVDAIDWTGRCSEDIHDASKETLEPQENNYRDDNSDSDNMAETTSEPFQPPPPPSIELQDFVKQCLRSAESRPTADDLLNHPFVAKGNNITPEYAGKWFYLRRYFI